MIRREFTKHLSSLLAICSISQYINQPVEKSTTILFQGDSITDAGRSRESYYANSVNGLGKGYVSQVSTELLGLYPEKNLRIYNRGVSGDKVHQLQNRWLEDCVQLKPDILSVMIGVNDYWHTLSYGYKAGPDVYRNDLIRLLNETKESFPSLKIIIAEPFYVPGGTAIDIDTWRDGFPIYQKISKDIAHEIKASFIPLQSIFDDALTKYPASYWCPDGVHPSLAGTYLMSEAWLMVLKSMI